MRSFWKTDKNNWRSRKKASLKLKEETKAIKGECNDKSLINKEIYDQLLNERMDEILVMSR